MKRCPTCQRVFADDNLAYCLDDGSTLWRIDSGSFNAPPTLQIPEPRITDQPLSPLPPSPPIYGQPIPPPPPVYGQPSGPIYGQPSGNVGFKLNNKIVGLSGAALVIIGVFMPLISFMGLISFSYFQVAQLRAAFFTAYLLPVIGGVALFMVLKNQFRPLIGMGVVVLAILLLDFFRIRSEIATLPFNLPGARPGATADPMASQYLQSMLQISWGFFAMVAGGILLIVAGSMKDTTSSSSSDWNRNPPPPPMNYS